MCGRFTRSYTWKQVHAFLNLIPTKPAPSNLQPRFNICPTTKIDAAIQTDEGRELQEMRWGLVPSWWSKPLKELKLATFNARAETVDTKPFFRSAFKRNRCLIPASGYYEWQTIGKEKHPWYFTPRDDPMFAIAGLWDEWTDRETGKPLRLCTMIITEPNPFVAQYHDRMPVLLQPDQFDGWMSGEAGKEILVPAADGMLQAWPVSKRVNSSRAPDEDSSLIVSTE
jgi:putative SOS response-associated peptidase YedK